MSLKRFRHVWWAAVMAALVVFSLAATIPDPSASPSVENVDQRQLADKYAPVMRFHPDEDVFPVNISYFLSSSRLMEIVDGEHRVVDSVPSVETIGHHTCESGDHYLDNRLGGIDDHAIVDSYVENESALGYEVYARVAVDGDMVAVQYWLFYVYNDGPLNHHEGDWEMIEVVLDGSLQPTMAAYSQHALGKAMAWGDIEREGDHPVAYVARGSHANFFHYVDGSIGLGRDRVGNDGRSLGPGDYAVSIIPEIGAGSGGGPAWTDYCGNWGEWGGAGSSLLGHRGPLGPAYRMNGAMWEGVTWAESISRIS